MLTVAVASVDAWDSPALNATAYVRMVAVIVCAYLVPRYFYQSRDWKRVLRFDRTLLKGVVVVIGILAIDSGVLAVLVAAPQLDRAGPIVQMLLIPAIGIAVGIPLMAVTPWGIGLIAGDHSMTLGESVRAMWGRWLWATLLVLACTAPLGAAHATLSMMASAGGSSFSALGVLGVLDVVVEAFVPLLAGAAYWMMYRIRIRIRVLDSRSGSAAPGPKVVAG